MDNFTYKHIFIDFLSQQIHVNEKPVKLDPKAFSTLKFLILNQHKVVNNEELIEQVWENRAITTEVITAAIARIRKLFKASGVKQEVIRTIHKVGYKFVLNESTDSQEIAKRANNSLNPLQIINIILAVILILAGIYIYQLNTTAEFASVPIKKTPVVTPVKSGNKSAEKITQIYFLRHAEKLFDGTDDPHLSENGINHANYWKSFFQHIEFDDIYTTKYHRNVETAKIVAGEQLDRIKIYSALSFDIVKHLPEFSGKTILIVAHSNTIPGMINRVINTNKYEPMSLEDYKSIFQVTIDSNNNIISHRFNIDWPVVNN